MPVEMSVWILAFSDYDEYTVVGIYTSEEIALAERKRVEDLQVTHGDRPRMRARREGHYIVEEFELNKTGCDIIVRVRGDGEVKETIVRVGYRRTAENYERVFEGIGETVDEAVANARKAVPPSTPE